MPEFLGIDTSNYTTSAAIYYSGENKAVQRNKLLPVKEGALGLRQSDAVFHHTKQLPQIVEELCENADISEITAVSASARPRNAEGSYMPCFLCGEGFGRSYSALEKIPFYPSAHQTGHILAALYSSDRLDLIGQPFIAFHVSGGTTDCLLCKPDNDEIFSITAISSSLDLHGGQAVDRVGLMLGLKFPCGAELEKLAEKADKHYKQKPTVKNGCCCLSGIENKCRSMLEKGESRENIAAYCLDHIGSAIISMTDFAVEKYGRLPLIFAGGVMSNKFIRGMITSEYSEASFAEAEFSCDNAVGIAIYAYLKWERENADNNSNSGK